MTGVPCLDLERVFDKICNPTIKKEVLRPRSATFQDQIFIQVVYAGSSLYYVIGTVSDLYA